MSERISTSDSLLVVQKLIIYAKSRAYDEGADDIAAFLNDIELLPELLADDHDRSDEFLETLRDVIAMHPQCQFVVDGLNDSAREFIDAVSEASRSTDDVSLTRS